MLHYRPHVVKTPFDQDTDLAFVAHLEEILHKMTEAQLFYRYHNRVDGHLILAAVLTPDNVDTLCLVTGAEKDVNSLLMRFTEAGVEHGMWCEYGDYVIADMAGKYRPADKRVFEDAYERLY